MASVTFALISSLVSGEQRAKIICTEGSRGSRTVRWAWDRVVGILALAGALHCVLRQDISLWYCLPLRPYFAHREKDKMMMIAFLHPAVQRVTGEFNAWVIHKWPSVLSIYTSSDASFYRSWNRASAKWTTTLERRHFNSAFFIFSF